MTFLFTFVLKAFNEKAFRLKVLKERFLFIYLNLVFINKPTCIKFDRTKNRVNLLNII